MLKKLYSLVLATTIVMNLIFTIGNFNTVFVASNVPAELKVDGTKIVTVNDPDVEVRLVGVNLPDLKWSNAGDGANGPSDVRNRIVTALDDWKSNVIRLGVESERWFGMADGQNNNPTSYRNLVDTLIQSAYEREKYIILDLHEFKAPLQLDLDFWKDAAVRYKNNPAVLFGLFNEPHGISWDVWRSGGTVDGNTAYGMQDLIEAVRDTGANNICVVGGLNWAYYLKDILTTGGLLLDQKTGGGGSGNGIVYDTHIYPGKGTTSSWEEQVMPMRAVAPVISGEFGYHAGNPDVMGSYKGTAEEYQTMLLNWFDKESGGYGSKMGWTAYSFHSSSSPPLLTSNATCEPTDYHGKYVYNKLQAIYNHTDIIMDDLVNEFEPDRYTNYKYVAENNSSITAEVDNSMLNVSFDKKSGPDKVALYANLPSEWDLSNLGEIHFDISDTVLSKDTRIRLGLHEKDGEDWAQEITFSNGMTDNIKIILGDLRKKENQHGDGYFTGNVESMYIEVIDKSTGSFKINNIILRCVSSQYYEYKNIFGTDIKVDPGAYNGPSPNDLMKFSVVDDSDSTGSKGLQFNYARNDTTANYGGNCYITFPDDGRWENLGKTKQIIFRMKDIKNGGSSPLSFNIKFEAGKGDIIGSKTLSFSTLIDLNKSIYEAIIPWNEVSWNANYSSYTMEERINAIRNVKFEVSSKGSGEVIFTQIEFSGRDYARPPYTPYKLDVSELSVDMDTEYTLKKDGYNYNGDNSKTDPENPPKFNVEMKSDVGIDGSKAAKITYQYPRASEWPGNCTMKIDPAPKPSSLVGSHYVSFYTRAGIDLIDRNVSITFKNSSGTVGKAAVFTIPASPEVESDEWVYHKFYFSDLGIANTEGIISLYFGVGTKSDTGLGYYYLDNIYFSSDNEIQEPIEYTNSFNPDIFTNWKSGETQNAMTSQIVSSVGRDGSDAVEFNYNGVGYVEANLPTAWDLYKNSMNYLNFWIKGVKAQPKLSNFTLAFVDGGNNTLFESAFQSIDNDWEHMAIPLRINNNTVNLQNAVKIRITNVDSGSTGKLLMDNFSLTNYSVERINIYRPIHNLDNFNGARLIDKASNDQKGWGNSTSGYYDYVKHAFVSNKGVDGSGALEIDVSTSSWFSGEVRLKLPDSVWPMRYVNRLEMDVRFIGPEIVSPAGEMRKLNLSIRTQDASGNIKSWGQNVDMTGDPADQWKHFTFYLSEFKSGDDYMSETDVDNIIGIYIKNGDGGQIGDGTYGTINYKTATLEQFEAHAKKGTFYIDNLAFTNLQVIPPVASNATLVGRANVGKTLIADYEYLDRDGDVENGSIGKWVVADDPEFTKNVKVVKTEFNTVAGTKYQYTLTDAEYLKYIKFTVIPKNMAEYSNEGEEISSRSLLVMSRVNSTLEIDFENGDWSTEDTYNANSELYRKNVLQDGNVMFTLEKSKGAIIDQYPENLVLADTITGNNEFSLGTTGFTDDGTTSNMRLWHNLDTKYSSVDTNRIIPSDGLVTFEIRVKRPINEYIYMSLYEDDVNAFTPPNNRRASVISLHYDGTMKYVDELVDGAKKTTSAGKNFIPAEGGLYIRQVLNLNTQKVDVYAGTSLDYMTLWNTFNFNAVATPSTMATGIGSISFDGKGDGLVFDDLHVYYTPEGVPMNEPVATDVKVEGKPNVGQQLTATYNYSDAENDVESGTSINWISADDANFTKNVVILKTDENTTAGTSYTYTITEAEKNKYIKMAVTPRNKAIIKNEGQEVSVGLPNLIGGIQTSVPIVKVDDIEVTTVNAPSGGNVTGSVTFTNTDSAEYEAVVVMARYDKSGKRLKSIHKSQPTTIPGCAGSENGIVTVTVDTSAANAVEMESGDVLKVFVWNGLEGIAPYTTTKSFNVQTKYECESLSTIATDGSNVIVANDTSASGGKYSQITPVGVGDYIQYTIPNLSAGTYNVKIGNKKNNNRGIYQLKIDGVDFGDPIDLYRSSTGNFSAQDLGNVTILTSGDVQFKLEVIGQNSASKGFVGMFDYILLTPQ